ncbi:serine/threonine protein kinase [Sorangium sp. So ce1151]|uniref:serine/threonine protein kinase n=1 Tax=Sorangium sp. So ce1151 TaxID=3133332 RepID=UPI003F6412AC
MSTIHSEEAPDCEAGLLSPEHRDDEWNWLPKIYEGADGRSYERCEKPIGSGGFGVVFEATARPSGKRVALKVAKENRLALRDMRIYGRLGDIPGVVRVLDYGRTEGREFVVMEFIDGPTLDAWIAEKRQRSEAGRSAPRYWLPIFDQVLMHVAGMHAKGHSHNDLKPTNVLMHPDGDDYVPLLSDFGLARRMPTSSSDGTHGPPAVSIEYCSPEQLDRKQGSPQSDVFSLVVMFIEFLTGSPRTKRGDYWARIAIANSRSRDVYASLNRTVIDIVAYELAELGINPNSTLGVVLRKGLEPLPTHRHRDADELREALQLRKALPIYYDVEKLGTSLLPREIEVLRRGAQDLRPLCDGALDMLDASAQAAITNAADEASAIPVRSTRGALAAVFLTAISLGGFVCIVARPGCVVDKSRTSSGEEHARVRLESLPNSYPPPPPPIATVTPTEVTSPSNSRGALRALRDQNGPIKISSFNDVVIASRNECEKPAQGINSAVLISFDADGFATVVPNSDLDANPAGRCVVQVLRRWEWKTGQPHTEAYWLRID